MKHIRIIVTTVLFGASLLSIKADALQDKVENGIERTEQLVASHLWQEAFAKLREADAYAEGRNDLKYLVEKQRYSMYSRLGKKAQMAERIARMEALARATSQTDIIEDMLIKNVMIYITKKWSKKKKIEFSLKNIFVNFMEVFFHYIESRLLLY